MRSPWMSTACLCLALALGPAAVRGDPVPGSASLPAWPGSAPGDAGIELQWWVIDLGGGISTGGGLMLTGSVLEPSDEPFAVLRGFESPETPATPTTEMLVEQSVHELALSPVTPNPTRGMARVNWSLPVESHVRLTVHDVQGRQIEVLADGQFPAGRHEVICRAGERGPEAAGIYFVRLQSAGRVLVRRLAVIR